MSTVSTYLAPRAETRRWSANGRAVSWRALAAAAALSSLLAVALWQSLPGRDRAMAPAAPGGRSAGFSHEGLLSLPLAARGPVSATLGAECPGLPREHVERRIRGGRPCAAPPLIVRRRGGIADLGHDARGVEPAGRRLRKLVASGGRRRTARERQPRSIYAARRERVVRQRTTRRGAGLHRRPSPVWARRWGR